MKMKFNNLSFNIKPLLFFLFVVIFQKINSLDPLSQFNEYDSIYKRLDITKIASTMYLTNKQLDDSVNNILINCNADISKVSLKTFQQKLKSPLINLSFHNDKYTDQDREKYNELLFYIDIKEKNNDEGINKNKMFFVAGEHPRELVSVDFMLIFLKRLCNADKNNAESLK